MDIRFINVEHSVKFKNIEQAENEANRLKMVLDRFAKKTKLAFTCIICISELSLKCGEYAAFHNGKRGRPKRREVSKLEPFASVAKVPPHLHIMIAYTRQEKAISEKIVKYHQKIWRSFIKGL